jgi:O-antigen/teichoic acid export membrane protein
VTAATDAGMGSPAPGLRERVAGGVLWSVAQRWFVRIGGLVTVVVLARLLTPEDFGLVAVAMAFIPVIYLLADLGFSTYVVQAESIESRMLSTAFWYAIAAGGVLSAALLLAGPAMAASLGLPDLAPVLFGLTPSVLLVAASSVPIALLRRRMAFRSLAIQSFAAGVCGQGVAVVLALTGFGVWALVAQLLVNQLVVAVLAWVFARYRPTAEFSWTRFRQIVRFGVSVTGVELVALARLWAETAIITAVLGVTGLGFINIAQRLIQATQDLSGAAIVPVSTVVFAQLKAAPERLAASYRRAVEIVYVIIFPIMIGVAIGAPLLVPLLFGEQWQLSVLPAQALAVAGILTLGAMLDLGLFYGLGRPGRWLGYAIAVDALTVLTTAVTVRFGLAGVALGFIGVALVATVLRWVMLRGLLGTTTWWSAKPFLSATAAAVPGAGVGIAILLATGSLPPFLSLVLVGVGIVIVQIPMVRLLLPEAFADIEGIVRRRLDRRRPGHRRFGAGDATLPAGGDAPVPPAGHAPGGGAGDAPVSRAGDAPVPGAAESVVAS